MAGIMRVVVKMRPSPAGGRPKRWARRKMDMVLQRLHDDKTAGIGRISVRPRSAPRTPGTRRRRWRVGRGVALAAGWTPGADRAKLPGDTRHRKSDADRAAQSCHHTARTSE